MIDQNTAAEPLAGSPASHSLLPDDLEAEQESWARPTHVLSARGAAWGAAIGLASGLLLAYLALFGQRLLGLPWPAPAASDPAGSTWFVPLLALTTLASVVYYARQPLD